MLNRDDCHDRQASFPAQVHYLINGSLSETAHSLRHRSFSMGCPRAIYSQVACLARPAPCTRRSARKRSTYFSALCGGPRTSSPICVLARHGLLRTTTGGTVALIVRPETKTQNA